jgi:hypothetical protein
VAVTIQYAFGWRTKSEVLTLKRSQVNLGACTIRLEPGQTKNTDGRLVYLTPELTVMLTAQIERVQILEMCLGRAVPYLFPHLSGQYRGRRIDDFRKAWKAACIEATLDLETLDGAERTKRRAELVKANANGETPGLLKMIRHDFRRTAVRNMVNRGVPERVAMTVTGHKTRPVFDRYHIVSPADLREAAAKLTGTFSGTLPDPSRETPSQLYDFTENVERQKTLAPRPTRPGGPVILSRMRKNSALPRLLKKVHVQGATPGTHPPGWVQARGVLSTYVAAPRERDNAAGGPFSATC